MNLVGVQEALRRHHRALTLAGVGLLVLGAWLAASAYARPISETRIERTTAWTEEASFVYRVPVTRNSTHWPIGTQLPMGEPAYFRTVSDSIFVDYAWKPSSAGEIRGVAGGTLSVHIEALTPDGRPYWSIEHLLDEATAGRATEGLALSGRLDLDELHRELNVLHMELPVTDGRVNWSVRADVVYSVEADGAREQGETQHVLLIDAGDPRYVLPAAEDLTWKQPHTESQAIVETRVAGIPGVASSWPILVLVATGSALLGAGVAFARAPGGEPFEREFRRFREWVSTAGRIPDHSAHHASTIDVRSLEDLVHVAADARTRVVLDERSRVFYAFLPGATYRYARHAY